MEYLFELSDNVLKSSRYDFKRYLFSRIPMDQRLVIIKGARGTGKSTIVMQLMQALQVKHYEKIYISADNIYFLENNLFGVADSFCKQISGFPDSYIAADNIETGSGNKIPLWLFGFLY